jgi:hypothetical protein
VNEARKQVRAEVRWPSGAVRASLVTSLDHLWDALDALKDEGMVPDEEFDISVRLIELQQEG